MRTLRIFLFDILAPGLIVGWILYKYPETLDRVIPWIALGVLWHLTLEILQAHWIKIRVQVFKRRFKKMSWIIAFGIGGFISVVYLLSIKAGLTELATIHERLSPRPASTHVLPVIEASAAMWPGGLPINVAPRKTAHVLVVRDNLASDMNNIGNDSDLGIAWPTKEKIDQFILLYKISNHDAVRVFNLKSQVQIGFYTSFPKELVKTITQGLVTDSIGPGEAFEVYVVNQSKYWIDIPLPTSADLQVQGSTEKVTVSMAPRGAFSDIPGIPGIEKLAMPLPPTTHKWK